MLVLKVSREGHGGWRATASESYHDPSTHLLACLVLVEPAEEPGEHLLQLTVGDELERVEALQPERQREVVSHAEDLRGHGGSSHERVSHYSSS